MDESNLRIWLPIILIGGLGFVLLVVGLAKDKKKHIVSGAILLAIAALLIWFRPAIKSGIDLFNFFVTTRTEQTFEAATATAAARPSTAPAGIQTRPPATATTAPAGLWNCNNADVSIKASSTTQFTMGPGKNVSWRCATVKAPPGVKEGVYLVSGEYAVVTGDRPETTALRAGTTFRLQAGITYQIEGYGDITFTLDP